MELWQIAKPFGRPALFKTPEELWQAFIAYVEWSHNNPMTVQSTKSQKQGSKNNEKAQYQQTMERPLTLGAFRLHANIRRDWATFKAEYSKKRNKDFCGVLQAIESSIRNQQVQNALVGNYKENLVARLNSISDTVEQKVTAQVSAKGMTVAEAQAFLDNLDSQI